MFKIKLSKLCLKFFLACNSTYRKFIFINKTRFNTGKCLLLLLIGFSVLFLTYFQAHVDLIKFNLYIDFTNFLY